MIYSPDGLMRYKGDKSPLMISAITSRLAIETLKIGKVPFYCAAWSNIKSVRNAIKSGFRPAWVELTARNSEFVDEMNK